MFESIAMMADRGERARRRDYPRQSMDSAKGRRESIAGGSTMAHSSRSESRDERSGEDYRWINLCPMNIETIFTEDEERPTHSRTGENERVTSTAASIKEETGGRDRDFRLCDRPSLLMARNRPAWRSDPVLSTWFLIVDEISSLDQRTSHRGTRNFGS